MRRSWGKSCPSFFHNFFQKKTPKLFQAFSQKQKNCNISWSRTPPSNSGFMLCIFCCILYHQAFSKKQNCDTSWSRTLASAPARSNSRTMSWLSKHTAIMSADHPRLCIRSSRSAPPGKQNFVFLLVIGETFSDFHTIFTWPVYPQLEVSTLLNQPLCHVTRPRPACLHQRRPARALLMYACITLLLLSSSSSPYICIYYIFLQGLMRGAQPTPCFTYIHIFYCHYLF